MHAGIYTDMKYPVKYPTLAVKLLFGTAVMNLIRKRRLSY